MHIRNSIQRHTQVVLVVLALCGAASCDVYDESLLDDVQRESDDALQTHDAAVTGCEAAQSCDAGPAVPVHPPAEETDPTPETGAPDDAAIDQCPNDPRKMVPGPCGCGTADTDSDRDGTADCMDACPSDARKTAAGSCGCGTPDTDSDRDGTPDCKDACPQDAKKTSVGMCGCGKPDTDVDEDGTADCIDACPRDLRKTSPGICGCGETELDDPTSGELGCIARRLLHRYSFDGTDDVARDSIGSASGMIVGAAAGSQSGGSVLLTGDIGLGYMGEPHVNLPISAWPNMASATFEAWVTWDGAAASGDAPWQRVFDFGDQLSGQGHTYLSLTPSGTGGVRAEFTVNGVPYRAQIVSAEPLPLHVMKHVAVVVDGDTSTMALYVAGEPQGSVKLPAKLTQVKPVNLWLGRSNFDRDPNFFGSLHEFRIYSGALTDAEVQASYQAGPDYRFVR